MKKFFVISILLLFSVGIYAQDDSEPLTIRVVSPPNPNAFPLFVAMDAAQETNLNIEFLPVPGVAEVADALHGGQADVALFFSAAGAKLYNGERLPNIRLWDVNIWNGVYLVTAPDVESLADLQGKTILASFQGGAPDLLMRAVMTAQGFDPDTDFDIQYMPATQARQLLIAGRGDAALLPEPAASQTIARAQQDDRTLSTLDLQADFESETWDAGFAPLGGVFVLQSTLDDPERRPAFDAFVALYEDASDRMNDEAETVAPLVSAGFDEYFGADIPAPMIATILESGSLTFESRAVSDLRPDLDDFLAQIVGKAPDEPFYAVAE